jgi:hypothetical protein
MDIKNVDLRNQQIKRDRMLSYWQSHVAEHFLPPVSEKRKLEVEARKIGNEPIKAKKDKVRSACRNRSQESMCIQGHDSTLKQP